MAYHINPDASTPVHDGISPGAWAPLDLLPVIGTADRWIVRLRAVSDGGNQYVDFRPADNTTIESLMGQPLRGCAGSRQSGIYACTHEVFTDPWARVGWRTSGGDAFKIYLLGWHDATAHDPAPAGPPDRAATIMPAVNWGAPAPFQMIDLGVEVGKTERLVTLEYVHTGGSGNDRSFYVRPLGGALLPHKAHGYTPRGPSNAQLRTLHPVQVATATDATGKIEQAQWSFVGQADIWIHGYISDWRPAIQALKAGPPPTSFGDDDILLGPHLPAGGVARLVVTRPDAIGGGVLITVSFRDQGSALDTSHGGVPSAVPRACEHVVLNSEENAYVDVEVPMLGHVEWEASTNAYNIDVDLVGFDAVVGVPPTISDEHPEGPTTSITTIGCTITDLYGLIPATLSLSAIPPMGQPLDIIVAGALQPGWSGYTVETDDDGLGPRRIEIVINGWPDLASPARWTFSVGCSSISGQSL